MTSNQQIISQVCWRLCYNYKYIYIYIYYCNYCNTDSKMKFMLKPVSDFKSTDNLAGKLVPLLLIIFENNILDVV